MNSSVLNNLINSARTTWQRWSSRERLLVVTAVMLLVVVLFYGLYWKPMSTSIDRLTRAVPEARSQVAQMRIQAKQIPVASVARLQKSLLPTLEESIDNHGLREQLRQLQPSLDDSAQVVLDQVNYVNLVKWLVNLKRQYGVFVSSAKIGTTDSPGYVNAQLVLSSSS